jgi:DNA-binding beta-propeller fold protein YncE
VTNHLTPFSSCQRASALRIAVAALALTAVFLLSGAAQSFGRPGDGARPAPRAGHLSGGLALPSGPADQATQGKNLAPPLPTASPPNPLEDPVHAAPHPAAAAAFSVSTGNDPTGMAYDPNNQELYVANHGKFNISIINVSTRLLVSTVSMPLYGDPIGLVYDSALNEILITNTSATSCPGYNCDGVSVLDPTTNTVTGYYPLVTGSNGTQMGIGGVALDTSNGMLFIQNPICCNVGNVLEWSTSSHKLSGNTSLCSSSVCSPFDLLYLPSTGDVYASSGEAVYAISGSTFSVVSTVTLGHGSTTSCLTGFYLTYGCWLTYDAATGTMWTSSGTYSSGCNRIYGYSLSTGTTTSNLSVNAWPNVLAISPSTNYLYASAWGPLSGFCSSGSPGVLQVLNASTGGFVANFTGNATASPALYALANNMVLADGYLCIAGSHSPGWVDCTPDVSVVHGWWNDPHFSITHTTLLSPVTLGLGLTSVTIPISVDLYGLSPAPSASVSTFLADAATYLGMSMSAPAGKTITNASIVLISIGGMRTLVEEVNSLYNTTIGSVPFGPGTFDLMPYFGAFFNSTGKLTLFGNYTYYGSGSLFDLAKEVASVASSLTDLLHAAPEEILSDVVNLLDQAIANFDAGTGLLQPSGPQNFVVFEGVSLRSLDYALQAASTLVDTIKAELKVLTDGARAVVSAEVPPLAVYFASVAILTQLDVLLDWLAPSSFVTSFADWFTSAVDPAGVQVAPAVSVGGHSKLGYNSTSASYRWSSNGTGFAIDSNGTWDLVLANRSSNLTAFTYQLLEAGGTGKTLAYDSTFTSNGSIPAATAYGYVNGTKTLGSREIVGGVGGLHNQWASAISVAVLSVTWNGSSFRLECSTNQSGRTVAALVTASYNGSNLTANGSKGGLTNITLGPTNESKTLLLTSSAGKAFGSATPVSIPTLYTVFFTERGLRAGTHWAMSLSGESRGGRTASLQFSETPGSYHYHVNAVTGYFLVNPAGPVKVANSTVQVAITFEKLYAVSFNETGLPGGTIWWVNISGPGGARYVLQSSTLWNNVSLVGGNYTFTIQAIGNTATPPNGHFRVTTVSVRRSVVFT